MKTSVRSNSLLCMLLSITLFFSCSIAHADGGDKFIIGERVSLHSKILDEDREIIVQVPYTHGRADTEYPVLFLLDGNTHFHHATGITSFLSAHGRIPEMIVVAICNVDRGRDFTPTPLESMPNYGGADKFLSFIEKELIPFIERNYRAGDFRLLAGHSLGGIFTTYTLLQKPKLFKGFITMSPYLMYDDEYAVKLAESKLKSSYDNIHFFMTLGEEPGYPETLQKFESIVKSKNPKGLQFSYTIYPDDDHGTVPHISIYDGLREIYSGYELPDSIFKQGLAAIDDHYQQLSLKYGMQLKTPEGLINELGYKYLVNHRDKEAIVTFTENVKRYPESSNVYDSLGEAYELNGQLDEAIQNYTLAVEIADKAAHPNLELYKKNLQRVKEKAALGH